MSASINYNTRFAIPDPAYIRMLQANPRKIDWMNLSINPAAIDLLKANPNKIDWYYLSTNPAAIDLLKANPDKIDWSEFYKLRAFTLDYKRIKETNQQLNEEIIAAAYHPSRIQKWIDAGYDIEDYLQ